MSGVPAQAAARTRLPPGVLRLVLTRGLSALGSGMTAFAINVFVFEKSHSYAVFASLTLLTSVPNLLLAPLVGMVVDRCHKKTLLAACELVTAAAVAFAWLAARAGALGLWQAGLAVLVLGIAGTLRWTLMGAAIGALVPDKDGLRRVNGLRQALAGVTEVTSPLLGAVALHAAGVQWVFVVDILTSLVAAFAVGALDAGLLAPRAQRADAARFRDDATFGLRWVMAHPPLRRLLVFVTGYNLVGSVYTVSFMPRLLGFAGDRTLGICLALEGAGAFAAGLALSHRRARALDPARTVYRCAALFAVVVAAWGLVHGPAGAVLTAAATGLLTSTIVASLQTTWHVLVPPELQGRVFAARRMVSYSLIPVATLLSIPLASHVMTPLLQAAPVLQRAWGEPKEGGLGLLISLLGALLLPASLFAARAFARAQPPHCPAANAQGNSPA